MKRIGALLLVFVIALGIVGCGNSKNKEKLLGKQWTDEFYYNSNGYMGIEFTSIDTRRYIFDSSGKCALIYTDNYEYIFPMRTMEIKTGTYKMDDKKITIHFTDNKIFKSSENTIEEKINEERTIPYYISEYNDELIFDSDSSGKSDYESSSWKKTIDESINYYENEYWPKFKERGY